MGKIVLRPVVTKLCANVRASEDRRADGTSARNATMTNFETPEVQAERIRCQRCRVDSLVALQGRRERITVVRVLRARS